MNQTPKLTTIEEDLRGELERISRLYPELCPTDQINRVVGNVSLAISRGADGIKGVVDTIISLFLQAMRKQASGEEVTLNIFILVSAVYLASKNDEQAKNKGRVILAS